MQTPHRFVDTNVKYFMKYWIVYVTTCKVVDSQRPTTTLQAGSDKLHRHIVLACLHTTLVCVLFHKCYLSDTNSQVNDTMKDKTRAVLPYDDVASP